MGRKHWLKGILADCGTFKNPALLEFLTFLSIFEALLQKLPNNMHKDIYIYIFNVGSHLNSLFELKVDRPVGASELWLLLIRPLRVSDDLTSSHPALLLTLPVLPQDGKHGVSL